jgi:putative SOS response-associated peptidase YedK
VEAIHPKAMPVILHEEDYGRRLDGDVEEVCSLAAPFPSQLMTMI